MREVEFLPQWYTRLRRRKRSVGLQLLVVLLIAAALGLWLLHVKCGIKSAQASLSQMQNQLDRAGRELHELDELSALKHQWDEQAKVVARLGSHVPAARLINALDEVMPEKMALLELSTETDQPSGTPTGLAAARGAVATVEKRMRVRLHGVAPTDVDLGNFLARLAGVPHFSDIAMAYSHDRTQQGHLMREFEVTFNINLSESDH